MKVLIHSFDFPPSDGGISRFCSELQCGFRSAGDEVRVLTQSHGSHSDGVYAVSPKRPQRELEAFRQLLGFRGEDLVISGVWYPEGLLTAVAGIKRTVILAHGSELMPPPQSWRRDLWKRMQRSVLESAALVVANSSYTAGLVRESAPAAQVVAIPLGVDHRFFTPGDTEKTKERFGVSGRIVLSSVSRLQEYKGHDVVLDALAALPEATRQNFVYLIAGKGPARAALESRAANLGIASLVRWLGYVPDEEMADLYRASNLFVLCTRERTLAQEVEGFGLVFLEAQSCGTPVLGTRTGGIPDAVRPGDGGWLVEQDDSAAVARILAELAGDPERFRLAGEAARARVLRECTWSHYFQTLITALRRHGLAAEDVAAHV